MKKVKILAALAAIFFAVGVGHEPVTAMAAGSQNPPAVSDTVMELKRLRTRFFTAVQEREKQKKSRSSTLARVSLKMWMTTMR